MRQFLLLVLILSTGSVFGQIVKPKEKKTEVVYDTLTLHKTVFDTIKLYDTVEVQFFKLVHDTVKVYDTVTVYSQAFEGDVDPTGFAFSKLAFEELKEQSISENKPFFVYFKASWCGPCKVMEKLVFADAGVQEYTRENYLALALDVDDFDGLEVASTYQVDILPEVLFFQPGGELMGRYRGVISPESFLDLLSSYK